MKHALILIALSAACVEPVEDSNVEDSDVAARVGCPTWGCGTNSPIVGDGLLFDELDPTGASANRGGIRVVKAKTWDGVAISLRVQRHSLIGYPLAGGWPYTGEQLNGTIIRLHHDISGDYELLIEKVHLQSLTFWAGAAEAVPAYTIKTRKLGEVLFKEFACKVDPITADPHWSGIEHAAIMFQGDRYDPDRKTVYETSSADPVFNLACAATAPAKMHLMRHTRAGSYLASGTMAYDTTIKERTAMLKMFTADYCGTGQSFTVDGQPLSYDDSNHWYREATTIYASQEALWSSEGAICLDTPRLYAKNYVDKSCGRVLPACGDFMDVSYPWTARAHVRSANP
jgi:ADYC domain-containing protein